MRIDENTYSRLVRWLQVLLPILALGVLSTLFLVPRTIQPAQELRYSQVDVDAMAREQRISQPNFHGMTEDGAAVSIKAETAMPDPNDPAHVTGQGIQAQIALRSGDLIDIAAQTMDVNPAIGRAALVGDVRITSKSGYRIATQALQVSLSETRLSSDQETRITGALGEITAGGFELSEHSSVRDRFVLLFKDGVRVLYTPGN